MLDANFNLDEEQSFPQLAKPPIVEAVIHWYARSTRPIHEESLHSGLANRLPEYPVREPLQEFELSAMMLPQATEPVVRHTKGWQGFRLRSADGRHVLQFKRDGLIFSRTQGYENWEQFQAAAKDAWQAYLEIAEPLEIQRLGVRFINQFVEATPAGLSRILREPPTCPTNLPLREFVYQSTFAVPQQPFNVRVIKLMQPTTSELPSSSGLFLDIDVFTTRALPTDSAALDEALRHMRRLKNEAFFSLLTAECVASLSQN